MATFTWVGGLYHNRWDTAGNWSENGSGTIAVPGPSDDAVVSSGVAIINTAVEVNSITVDAGAAVELYGRVHSFYTSSYGVIIGATLAGAGTFELTTDYRYSPGYGGRGGLNGVTIAEGTTFVDGDGFTTYLQGVIINNGTMVLDAGKYPALFESKYSATIAGSGTVLLNNNANDALVPNTNLATRQLTIGAEQHVVGGGNVGGSGDIIFNLGTIAATEVGSGAVPLTLNVAGNSPVGWTNDNLMVADGGTLVIYQGGGSSLTQSASGIIDAVSGGVVALTHGIVISGGALATDSNPGSQIDADAHATLYGVTLTEGSRLTIPDNNYAILGGVITNDGTIVLTSTGNPTRLLANTNNATTLTGNGVVLLNDPNDALGPDGNTVQFLTIEAGQTIEGAGNIGGGGQTIVNNGTIAATEAGSGGAPLTLDVSGNSPTGWFNKNIMVADAGTLIITQGNGGQLTQTGSGIIEAVGGGVVALAGGITISGGQLATDSAAGSQIDADAHATLAGVTLTGGSQLTVPDNNYALLHGVITNDGTITLASTGNTTSLRVQGTLSGNGVVLLDNANDRVTADTGYDPRGLTIDVGQTIAGGGYIGGAGLSVTNLGTIAATEAGSGGAPLTLAVAANSPISWVNENVIVADGGTLILTEGGGGALTQAGSGIIEAVSGGVVALTGGIAISGGQLGTDSAAGSQIDADAHTTLDGVTLTGGANLIVPDTNYVFLTGAITNDGTMTLNGATNNTDFRLIGSVTLAGSGSVLLNDSNLDRIVGNFPGPNTLTIGAGQTIAGGGQAGAGDRLGITNFGTLEATETGSGAVPLTVYPSYGLLNQSGGVIEAASGATLIVTGGGLTNDGIIAALSSGSVNVAGTVAGSGSITIDGGGTVAIGNAVAAGQTVDLTAPGGTLALADPSQFSGTIAGLAVGSSTTVPINDIDLTTIAAGTISAASLNTVTDQLSVVLNGGSALTLQLSGTYAPGTVVDAIADTGGGTDLFLSTAQTRQAPSDFDGDGMSDVLWRENTGNVAIWDMNGLSVAANAVVGFADPSVWTIDGNGDFNGDGKADILWRDSGGNVAIWQMNGFSLADSAIVGFADPSVWAIGGTGDFNGDGRSDILWHDSSGDVAIWEMNGFSVAASPLVGFADPSLWHIEGTGDFNGDGTSDILWRDSGGDVAVWEMNGASVVANGIVGFADPSVWHIAGTGDFNGDGKSDILWQDTSGDVAVWEMNGLSVAASAIVGFADATQWQIQGTGDYNADGKSDILWRSTSGNVAVWEMNGFSIAASGIVGFADPTAWHIVAPNNAVTAPTG